MTSRRRVLAATMMLAALELRTLASVAAPLDPIRFAQWGAEPLRYLDAPPYFLSKDDLAALPIAPPPANDSPTTRAELDELLRLQAARTAEERAAIERHLDYAPLCALFVSATGRELASMPRTRTLLEHVNLDGRWAVFHAKRRFARARPDQLEPRLHPSIPVPRHPAYPSAHAIQGYLLGRVLSQLAPERRDVLTALGVEVAHEREIAGVHYASDAVAGQALGEAVFALLQSNGVFTREIEAARGEWGAPPVR